MLSRMGKKLQAVTFMYLRELQAVTFTYFSKCLVGCLHSYEQNLFSHNIVNSHNMFKVWVFKVTYVNR